MKYVGIDLHKKRRGCAVVDQDGQVLRRRTIPSTPQAFQEEFSSLDPLHARVVLEATVNWYWAADTLQDMGLDVHLANPRRVRLIAESTIKTDTVDATALANLLRMNWLPESRITPRRMRLLWRLLVQLVSRRRCV